MGEQNRDKVTDGSHRESVRIRLRWFKFPCSYGHFQRRYSISFANHLHCKNGATTRCTRINLQVLKKSGA